MSSATAPVVDTASLKIIWMSDPHFTANGDVLGHDPKIRLDAAINHINAHHSDADLCVVSGDMVNRGTQTDYGSLSRHLSALRPPMLPMVGNHDDRALLRETLPLPGSCMSRFVQYSVSKPGAVIACLDTQKTGSDAGEFCDERAAWLENILENAGDTPVYLFLHHPPHALGLPMQDTENMENGDAFLDLISQYECVKYLFFGHVHRPISGTVRGLPFSTMRSILYQAPAPRPAWNWDTFKPSEEPPSIGVITISDASVTLQYEQFCHYQDGVSVA